MTYISVDKFGQVEHPQWLYRGFWEAVEDCNISDIPLTCYKFTWIRSRGTPNMVEERLNKAMANSRWH